MLKGPAEILAEKHQITEIGPSVRQPEGAEVIDLSGRTVSPGFIDTRVHLTIDAANLARQTLESSASKALKGLSLAALKIALAGAAEAGAETTVLDLRKLNLPMYQPDAVETPEEVSRVIDLMYHADGLLWSSPMYNGTISGAFKNALDWLHLPGDREPPFLTDKIVGLISTAGGAGLAGSEHYHSLMPLI